MKKLSIVESLTAGFAALILIVIAGLVVSTTASYATADANYTDGTVGSDLNGNDWGAPPGAPTLDIEEGSVCIDPPQKVWMTIHEVIDGVESNALTIEYVHTTPGYACAPFTPPACPVEKIEYYGTWNIGTGRSPSLFIDRECPTGELAVVQTCETGTDVTLTNTGDVAFYVDSEGPFFEQLIQPGGTSTANVGSEAGSLTVHFGAYPESGEATIDYEAVAACPLPPVEIAPPAAVTAVPVAAVPVAEFTPAKPLPKTGSSTTTLAGVGIAALVLGLVMVKTHTAKRGLTV